MERPRTFSRTVDIFIMASVEVILSWVITSVIGLLAVLFMRKIPRSRGRPPKFISEKFGKAGTVLGSLLFIGLYIVGAFVILLVMPEIVQDKLFSPAGVVVVGTVFPHCGINRLCLHH